MKFTIFTVQLTDNNYLNDPICKLCIDSWNNLKNKIIEQGHSCEIKIFGPNDDEVVNFKKIYPKTNICIKMGKLTRLSNAFRFYILSKYKNYIWLDSDIYIPEHVQFENNYYIGQDKWCILANSNKKRLFKKVWKYYKSRDLLERDSVTHEKIFGCVNIGYRPIKDYIHLTTLMKNSVVVYVKNNDFENITNFIKTNLDNHTFDEFQKFRIVLVSQENLSEILNWCKECKKNNPLIYLILDNCIDDIFKNTILSYKRYIEI